MRKWQVLHVLLIVTTWRLFHNKLETPFPVPFCTSLVYLVIAWIFFINDLNIGDDDGYYDWYLSCLLSVPSGTLLQPRTKEFPPTPFLCAFAKLRKQTVSSVLSVSSGSLVRVSLPMQQSGSQWTDFLENFCEFFLKVVEKIEVRLKCKRKRHIT